jgi:hypothetical protein
MRLETEKIETSMLTGTPEKNLDMGEDAHRMGTGLKRMMLDSRDSEDVDGDAQRKKKKDDARPAGLGDDDKIRKERSRN